MVKKVEKQVLSKYYSACIDLVDLFKKKYFDEYAVAYSIGDDMDGVYEINDYYFNLSDMREAIELDYKWKDLDSWYEQWTDENNKTRLNLWTYKYLINSKLK